MTTPFSWVWSCGQRVPRESLHIDPLDEGLLYGLGLFETTRTFDGIPWLWDEHLRRLRSAARFLNIAVEGSQIPSKENVQEFVTSLDADDVVVRLNVTAGTADRHGTIWLMARPLPTDPESVKLATSPYRVSMRDPVASHKCLSYTTRLLAHREALRVGADDALILDPTDLVLEAAFANLFVRMPEGWITPPLAGGVLNGTVRELLLEHQEPPEIRPQLFTVSRLAQAQEIFVTNSVHGITPVTQVDDRRFSIGSETQRLRDWVRTRG